MTTISRLSIQSSCITPSRWNRGTIAIRRPFRPAITPRSYVSTLLNGTMSTAYDNLPDQKAITVDSRGTDNGRVQVSDVAGRALNAWETPGSAAYDFRSDTSTTPTAAMLSSLAHTTLLDDVHHEDPTTNALEAYCASLLGHTSGLLTQSGTMGNQLAVRAHLTSPPHSLLADARAHILEHEAGAVSSISGAYPLAVSPSNGSYLTLEDVLEHVQLPTDDFHLTITQLICLENTLGGGIMPLTEAKRITDWARKNGIPTHLDGARLWEAVAAQVARGEHGASLEAGMRAYGQLFDSVTVCFSKGLGAPIGSVLVGSKRWIHHARHLRKMLGGGMRMTGIIAAPAKVAVEDTFLGMKLVRSHELVKKIEAKWIKLGGKIVGSVETNMVWLDLAGAGIPEGVFPEEASTEGLKVFDGKVARVVCHYQISDDAVSRLGRVMERLMERRQKGVVQTTTSAGVGFRYNTNEAKNEKQKAGGNCEKVDCV